MTEYDTPYYNSIEFWAPLATFRLLPPHPRHGANTGSRPVSFFNTIFQGFPRLLKFGFLRFDDQ